ncbi:APH(3'') family aminoglycoside O-phosphotransferase [Nocardia amikacinitolerans]|uniref:APH(3'') family aminoglycoside O-phosphotransferase n=1 Tax=Nocardia amikacinitolerans TaxID=756689 RepID=UPI0020A2F460|nr:APH(3'') family aminoglycoside O-phosphotransferase [Nocardia amikacinitolerans]MCP2288606.1 streptomycin 3'-kinase [Nocardia amikacinitolerans]
MPDALTRFRSVLPADAEWEPVDGGESGAAVFRAADGSRYAKCVAADSIPELREECDRVAWFSGHEIPGPQPVLWQQVGDAACLVTTAVHGVPADRVSAEELSAAWASIAEAVRTLHEIPTDTCPFERDVTKMFAKAQDVVARGAVNPEFLPEEQLNTPTRVLLARLRAQLDLRIAQEAAEYVVCHGDLCLPNIVLDPDTGSFAGFLDLGRLGVADPYVDIALLLANSRETWPDERSARDADRRFAERYGIDLDADRQRFYLHLDPLTWG